MKSTFEDANQYMKDGVLLRQVLNIIDSVDFGDYEESHAFGEIYEAILKELQSAGSAGEFYTPRAVTDFMAQMIKPRIGEKMADFACGTGGFLVSWLKELEKQVVTTEDSEQRNCSIFGIEKKQFPYMLAITNMLLHGVDIPQIYHNNSLLKDVLDYTDKEKFDVVLMNPPFGGSEKADVKQHFPQDMASSETSDLFVALILYRLKQTGRAAVVLPEGFLNGIEGAKVSIKKKMLSEFNLHTIIKLPNTTFSPYATVATNILFFEAGSPTSDIWIYQHRVPKGQKNYSKTNPIRIEEFSAEREWWCNRKENENAWKITATDVAENDYKIDFKNPNALIEEEVLDPRELVKDVIDNYTYIGSLLQEIDFNDDCIADTKEFRIGDICTIEKGKSPIKKTDPGDYPMVVTAEERLTSNEYQFDGEAVCIPLVSSTGHGHASIKRIHYQEGKFALGNILCAVSSKNESILSTKYLYTYLSFYKDDILVPLMKGTTNVSLNIKDIKAIILKLPPIEKHLDIVEKMGKVELIVRKIAEAETVTQDFQRAYISNIFKGITI